jgi:serine/threonine protein kinase
LHEAHQQGLVHGSLRPGRVLFSDTGIGATPRIIGLGDVPPHYDFATMLPGTRDAEHVCYLAPEQTRGEGALIGPGTDVYALGVILYQMLTGRPPFLAATVADTAEQIRTRLPVFPSQLQPSVPWHLTYICEKCLVKQPDRRYSSAQALAADLRRFLAGSPIAPPLEQVMFWIRARPVAASVMGGIALAFLILFWSLVSTSGSLSRTRAEVEKIRAEQSQKETAGEEQH